MNIIQACNDSNLFAPFFGDNESWQPWFTFLRVLFGLPCASEQDMLTFKQCTGRTKWPQEPLRESWVISGRRSGKSFISALIATYYATFKEHKLSLGETGYVLICSPTKQQSRIIKGYLSGFFNDNKILKKMVVRETGTEIELNNNVTIMVMSSDFRSLRGYTGVCAIVDEVAFMTTEGSRPDFETLRALRPCLVTTNGLLICISSPYAKQGALYNAYKNHYGKDESNSLVWQSTSLQMNPTLNKELIARAKADDPDGAGAEWDAQFRSDIESVISREVAEACVRSGCYEQPPVEGIRYNAFTDPAGGSGKDSFTLSISHREGKLRVLDLVRETRPPFSPEGVCKDYANLLKRYNLYSVTGDKFGGMFPRERFSKNGITYRIADKSKSELYKELIPLLNSGEVELLDNKKLINQLCNLERRTARGGRDSIDHPPNGHDDLINAVAGTLTGATKKVNAGVWGYSTNTGDSRYDIRPVSERAR